MVRHRKPPSQTWRTFLTNHVSQLVSIDYFTVHTIGFEILFVFVVFAHHRRRIVHFNVTSHPPAEWTAQQIVEAFPFDTAPKYLLRDRDRIYGHEFRKQIDAMGIHEILSAPRSPWQRAYVERVIGSIRRECLDHVIVFDEESLRRTLRSYLRYSIERSGHALCGNSRSSISRAIMMTTWVTVKIAFRLGEIPQKQCLQSPPGPSSSRCTKIQRNDIGRYSRFEAGAP
jgi:transposase InsO family protein